MPGHRKEAEAFILSAITAILPDGANTELYKKKFAAMSDEDFDAFMKDCEEGRTRLCVIVPNGSKTVIDMERNFAVGEAIGHKFFERIWVPATKDTPEYLTPIEYFVGPLPARRQAQLLEKKISIPEDNNTVDDLTGQPTGGSKGSKISYPEVQVLAALGLDHTLEETITMRGGDERGFAAMNTMISRTGGVSLKAIRPYASGVKSKQALRTFLLGMHVKSNI